MRVRVRVGVGLHVCGLELGLHIFGLELGLGVGLRVAYMWAFIGAAVTSRLKVRQFSDQVGALHGGWLRWWRWL